MRGCEKQVGDTVNGTNDLHFSNELNFFASRGQIIQMLILNLYIACALIRSWFLIFFVVLKKAKVPARGLGPEVGF